MVRHQRSESYGKPLPLCGLEGSGKKEVGVLPGPERDGPLLVPWQGREESRSVYVLISLFPPSHLLPVSPIDQVQREARGILDDAVHGVSLPGHRAGKGWAENRSGECPAHHL